MQSLFPSQRHGQLIGLVDLVLRAAKVKIFKPQQMFWTRMIQETPHTTGYQAKISLIPLRAPQGRIIAREMETLGQKSSCCVNPPFNAQDIS